MEEMKSTKVEKELLTQKCRGLEMQLNHMKEESEEKVTELQKLADQARILKDEVEALTAAKEKAQAWLLYTYDADGE